MTAHDTRNPGWGAGPPRKSAGEQASHVEHPTAYPLLQQLNSRKFNEFQLQNAEQKTGAAGAHPGDAPLAPASGPVVVDAVELLASNFPPRERLLSPWLLSQSLSMIYAPRGVGKTHVAMGVAYALASGGKFLGWRAGKPVPVLYLDGEMPGADLQDRLRKIVASFGNASVPGGLMFMTPDKQPNGTMPNLFNFEGQQSVTDAAAESCVIIVDNLSALVRGGKENEGEGWQPVAEWALRMRSSGRSVVFIHHAGKTGQQRGTSKREDLLDTVIALRRPNDYMPRQGARFEIHFEKARALYGEDVAPVEAMLETDNVGRQSWTLRPVSDANETEMIEFAERGMSSREIGAELGVNHSTVVRALKKAAKEGRYTPQPKNPGGRPNKAIGEASLACPAPNASGNAISKRGVQMPQP